MFCETLLMDFFFGSSSQPAQAPDVSHTIDKLCDRVRDADLLEDRRSAVQGLRGISRDFQLVKFMKIDRIGKVLQDYFLTNNNNFSKLERKECRF